MSALHLVCGQAALSSCLKAARRGDALLLLGDGAYAGADARLATQALPVAVIAEDAESRGVTTAPAIKPINYTAFVALVVEHDVSVTWT